MIEIIRDVEYTQSHGCQFCLHVGTTAYLFGTKMGGRGPRLEFMTPMRWFRWSRDYTKGTE